MATLNQSTIGGTTPDYTTPILWEADTDNDLVAGDLLEEGRLRAVTFDQGSSVLDFLGATVDSTRFRRLLDDGTPYNPHDDTGPKITSTNTARTVRVRDGFEELERFASRNAGAGGDCVELDGGSDVTCDGLTLIKGTTTGNGLGVSDTGCILRNLLLYQETITDSGSGIITFVAAVVHNCTAQGWHDAIRVTDGATTEIKNCIADPASGGEAYDTNQTYTSGTFNFNISTDTTAPGTNSTTSATDTDLWEDPANNDYRLKVGSDGIDNAEDLSGTFTTSILGTVRTGASFDAGCYDSADTTVAGADTGFLAAYNRARAQRLLRM